MNHNSEKTIMPLLTSFLPLHTMKSVNTIITLKLISMCIFHVTTITTLMIILIDVWSTLTQLKLSLILLPSMFLKPSIRNRRITTSYSLSLDGWMLTSLRTRLSILLNTRSYQQAPPHVVPSVPLTLRLMSSVEMK
jgi:hypothetical protein